VSTADSAFINNLRKKCFLSPYGISTLPKLRISLYSPLWRNDYSVNRKLTLQPLKTCWLLCGNTNHCNTACVSQPVLTKIFTNSVTCLLRLTERCAFCEV
jgi:hypothetical protein